MRVRIVRGKGETMEKYDYILHTDGGYSLEKNVGAFAFVICNGEDEELTRGAWKIEKETNNRAELKAIIAGLYNIPQDNANVLVLSDSQYALYTCSGTWSRRKNTDLFEVHDRVVADKSLSVTYKWVKGHNGDKFNEICDRMCNDAAGMDLNAEFTKYKKK